MKINSAWAENVHERGSRRSLRHARGSSRQYLKKQRLGPLANSLGEGSPSRERFPRKLRQLFSFVCWSGFVVSLLVRGEVGADTSRPVLIIEINGPISPATDDYLKTSLRRASERNAKLLVIKLNTPGGLLTSTTSMVESLLASEIPTVVYVSPTGGSATSAGVFITLAGNIAAMAPGTTIGAAHPVSGDGGDIGGDMREKIENFAVSQIKSIAEQRGRNMTWAEQAVRESVSITDREALQLKVIDIVAGDMDRLLADLEGRTVTVKGVPLTLSALAASPREPLEMSFKQQVLNILCDPNIAILLGLGAMLGIGIEFYHPGGALPGVVGVICLILSLIAAQVLPINAGGAALVALGLLFIVIEGFVPAFGMWGIAGIVCFVLGAIYLIDTDLVWSVSGFGVDRILIGSVAAIFGALLLGAVYLALSTRKRQVATGKEGLINKRGVVKREFIQLPGARLEGKVQVMGELWNARQQAGSRPLVIGDAVTVVAVEEGMTLLVESVKE